MIATTGLLTLGSMAELGSGIAAGTIPDVDVALFGAALEPAGITDSPLTAGIDSYLSGSTKSEALSQMVLNPGRARYLGAVQGQLGLWGFRPPQRSDLAEGIVVPDLFVPQSVSSQLYAGTAAGVLQAAGSSGRTRGPDEKTIIMDSTEEDWNRTAFYLLRQGKVQEFHELRRIKDEEDQRAGRKKWRPNLFRRQFPRASLEGAKLDGVVLYEAKFTGALLRLTKMRRADLRGADFTGARLIVTDLREADLRRADFTGARLDGTLLDGANLEGANLEGAVLEKPFLRGVKNLTSEQLSKVARAVGIHVFPNQAAIMERAFGQPQPKGEATLIGVAPYVVEKDG